MLNRIALETLCALIQAKPDRYLNGDTLKADVLAQDYAEIWAALNKLPENVKKVIANQAQGFTLGS